MADALLKRMGRNRGERVKFEELGAALLKIGRNEQYGEFQQGAPAAHLANEVASIFKEGWNLVAAETERTRDRDPRGVPPDRGLRARDPRVPEGGVRDVRRHRALPVLLPHQAQAERLRGEALRVLRG